jgi:hypothetical protein
MQPRIIRAAPKNRLRHGQTRAVPLTQAPYALQSKPALTNSEAGLVQPGVHLLAPLRYAAMHPLLFGVAELYESAGR